jgi:hypothetical protein
MESSWVVSQSSTGETGIPLDDQLDSLAALGAEGSYPVAPIEVPVDEKEVETLHAARLAGRDLERIGSLFGYRP